MSTTPQPPTPTILKPLTGTWTQRCCACGKTYPQGVGSTQCCGSLGEVIDHHPEQPPTPRCDQFDIGADGIRYELMPRAGMPHWPTLARQLERELSTALARIAALEKERDEAKTSANYWNDQTQSAREQIRQAKEVRDTLAARVAALTKELDAVRLCFTDASHASSATVVHVEVLQEKIAALTKTICFFASVIKSGESWSTTCQESLDAALASPTESPK